MEFIKLNRKPLKVYETITGKSYFNFQHRRFYLNDFLRIHNNPWFNGKNYPGSIHGFYNSYYYNIYIEIIEGYEVYINVYKLKEDKQK